MIRCSEIANRAKDWCEMMRVIESKGSKDSGGRKEGW